MQLRIILLLCSTAALTAGCAYEAPTLRDPTFATPPPASAPGESNFAAYNDCVLRVSQGVVDRSVERDRAAAPGKITRGLVTTAGYAALSAVPGGGFIAQGLGGLETAANVRQGSRVITGERQTIQESIQACREKYLQ